MVASLIVSVPAATFAIIIQTPTFLPFPSNSFLLLAVVCSSRFSLPTAPRPLRLSPWPFLPATPPSEDLFLVRCLLFLPIVCSFVCATPSWNDFIHQIWLLFSNPTKALHRIMQKSTCTPANNSWAGAPLHLNPRSSCSHFSRNILAHARPSFWFSVAYFSGHMNGFHANRVTNFETKNIDSLTLSSDDSSNQRLFRFLLSIFALVASSFFTKNIPSPPFRRSMKRTCHPLLPALTADDAFAFATMQNRRLSQ